MFHFSALPLLLPDDIPRHLDLLGTVMLGILLFLIVVYLSSASTKYLDCGSECISQPEYAGQMQLREGRNATADEFACSPISMSANETYKDALPSPVTSTFLNDASIRDSLESSTSSVPTKTPLKSRVKIKSESNAFATPTRSARKTSVTSSGKKKETEVSRSAGKTSVTSSGKKKETEVEVVRVTRARYHGTIETPNGRRSARIATKTRRSARLAGKTFS